jgi:small redox-active disulfide protein 2
VVKIKILGTGCAKCRKLYAEAEKAIAASGAAVELEKVEALDEIVRHGVMVTPALVLDDAVKACGRVPPVSEIVGWIAAAKARG